MRITDVKIIGADKPINKGFIELKDGKISKVSQEKTQQSDIDASGLTVLPGYIDVHTHGRENHHPMDGSTESVIMFAESQVKHGVTSFMPTTETAPHKDIIQALIAIKEAQNQQTTGANIIGAHLEGPYINTEARGAQLAKDIRPASKDEYQPWLDMDIIKLATVAPEILENKQFITDGLKQGMVTSIGHSVATFDEVRKAVELGARQSTHTFNGMKGLHHREPGTLGGVLLQDEVYCEVIGDLIHVHPQIIKLLIKVKGIEKVMLITDSVHVAGLPDGEYEALGDIVKMKDGEVRNKEGSLAGSTLAYDQGVRNMVKATGMPIEEIWKVTSYNQAQQFGLNKGQIKEGFDADLVLVDDNLKVMMTIVGGEVVYDAR